MAALGPLIQEYLFYQRLSDDAAHPSSKSLHRYMVTGGSRSGGWSGYKSGAGDQGENEATLHSAILAALPIGIGITVSPRGASSGCRAIRRLAEHVRRLAQSDLRADRQPLRCVADRTRRGW